MVRITAHSGLGVPPLGSGERSPAGPAPGRAARKLPAALLLLRRHNLRLAGRRSWAAPARASPMNGSAAVEEEEEYYDDEDEFEGGMKDELSCLRGLVLDAAYRPVSVVCWKRAICLDFMEKADVLEYYDQTVQSSRGPFPIPAVLRVPHLLQVVKRRRVRNSLSRKNILYRDSFKCQYCSSQEDLTIDHVLPISLGGKSTWENMVTACARCNSRKGKKTLVEANMKLIKTPKAPKEYDILAIPLTLPMVTMLRARQGLPEEWLQYLPDHSPLS